jgi:WD40 repeat protein/serine/threonine protein kinase
MPNSRPTPSRLSGLDSVLADLVEELAERLRTDPAADVEAFLKEHANFAERLRPLLPAVALMAELGRSEVARVGASTVTVADHRVTTADEAGHNGSGVLGDFRILREIGRGGMGVVYEAEQISLKRRVALKVLPFAAMLDPRHLQRFRNEAQAAAQLHHTNIVPVFAVGSERNVYYYAMQYIEGQTLDAMIGGLRRRLTSASMGKRTPEKSPDRLTPQSVARPKKTPGLGTSDVLTVVCPAPAAPQSAVPCHLQAETATTNVADRASTSPGKFPREYFQTVADFGVQAAEALDYAHEHGIVHRDIKPSNLILDEEGNLWVTDFGLARIESDSNLTMTGDVLGTLRYMSPEQALAKRPLLDHRTDVYSLGATLYELLVLQPAFPETDRRELLRQIADEDPPHPRSLNKAIPVELEIIVAKAMAKDADDRYATAKDFAADLHRYLEQKPITARPPTLADRTFKWVRRHTIAVVAALAIFCGCSLVLGTSTVWVFKAKGDADNSAAAAKNAAKRESIAAEQARRERANAKESEQTAKHARHNAERQRVIAEGERDLALRLRYRSDIKLAQEAWGHRNATWMAELLAAHRDEKDLLGWEWQFLWSLCHQGGFVVESDPLPVVGVALSPDNRYVAAVTEQTIALWEIATKREIFHRAITIPPGDYYSSVWFSGDGRWLVARDRPLTQLTVFEAATGETPFDRFRIVENGISLPYSLAISADGLFVAHPEQLPGQLPRTRVRRIASDDGPLLDAGLAAAMEFNNDGSRLYHCPLGGPNRVSVFDTATGRSIFQLDVPSLNAGVPSCPAWSPDGSKLAVWTQDEVERSATIRVIAANDGALEALKTLAEWSPTNLLQLHAWSHDSTILAIALPNRIKIWKVGTTEEPKDVAAQQVRAVRFSRNGALIWHDGSYFSVYDLAAQRETFRGYMPCTLDALISPSGEWITEWAPQIGLTTLAVRQLGTGAEIGLLSGQTSWVRAVCWGSDGRRIATGSNDGTLMVSEFQPAERLAGAEKLLSLSEEATALAWSPSGDELLAGLTSGHVQLWRFGNGRWEESGNHKAIGSWVRVVGFGPRGDCFFVGGDAGRQMPFSPLLGPRSPTMNEGMFSVRTREDQTVIFAQGEHAYGLRWAGWNPKDGIFASLSGRGILDVFDTQSWQVVRRIEEIASFQNGVALGDVRGAWSPDGKTIAVGLDDGTVTIFAIGDETRLPLVLAHGASVLALEFSPDGKMLATGAADGWAGLWSLDDSSNAEQRWRAHQYGIKAIAWSPDGRRLATGSGDETKIWNSQTLDELLLLKCNSEVSCLTWDPSGARLAAATKQGILIWDGSVRADDSSSVRAQPRSAEVYELSQKHSRHGLTLFRRDSFRRAEDEFRQVLELQRELERRHPTVRSFRHGTATGQLNLGKTLAHLGRLEEARTLLEDAAAQLKALDAESIAYHPFSDTADAFIDLGQQSIVRQNLPIAIAACNRAAPLLYKPGQRSISTILVRTSELTRILARASESGANSASLAPAIDAVKSFFVEFNEVRPGHFPEALNDGAWFLATCPVPGTREPQRAVDWATQAVTAKPGEATLWNTLGVAHYRDENWPAALSALQKSVDLQDGGTGFDWFFLAMIHWQLGEKDESRNWFDKAVEWMDKNGPHDDELIRFRTEAQQLLEVRAPQRLSDPARDAKTAKPTED